MPIIKVWVWVWIVGILALIGIAVGLYSTLPEQSTQQDSQAMQNSILVAPDDVQNLQPSKKDKNFDEIAKSKMKNNIDGKIRDKKAYANMDFTSYRTENGISFIYLDIDQTHYTWIMAEEDFMEMVK